MEHDIKAEALSSNTAKPNESVGLNLSKNNPIAPDNFILIDPENSRTKVEYSVVY